MSNSKNTVQKETLETTAEKSKETEEQPSKIYCANCIHCKLVPAPAETLGQFYLRVRCNAGKWKKKLGGEKQYKYFTVTRRSIEFCDEYEPMGDCDTFISDLRRNLPIRDEIYDKD